MVFRTEYAYEGAVLHLIPDEVAQRLTVVFASFLVWTAVFLIIYSRPTSDRLLKKAHANQIGVRTHRAELATRLAAGIHAAFVATGAGSLVFFRKNNNLYVEKFLEPLTWPKFNVHNDDAVFYACVSAGFFIADFILCVVQLEEQGTQFVVHAVAGLSGCVYCLMYGEGLLYLMLLMLFEVSTPFLHMRWWLLEYEFKDTPIYTLNGLALVFAFTLFRLVIGVPVLLKMVYELHTSPEKDRHDMPMRITFTLAPLAMIVLNSMWGMALWRGFLKAVGLIKDKKKVKSS